MRNNITIMIRTALRATVGLLLTGALVASPPPPTNPANATTNTTSSVAVEYSTEPVEEHETLTPQLNPTNPDVIPTKLLAIPFTTTTPNQITNLINQIGHGAKLQVNPAENDPQTLVQINVPESEGEYIAEELTNSGLFRAVDYDSTGIESFGYTSNPNDPVFNGNIPGIPGPYWPENYPGWENRPFPGANFQPLWGMLGQAGPWDSAPIAVIDSGFYLNHEDLQGNTSIIPVWDYGQNRASVYPVEGTDGATHGTSVLGMIAATANNGKGGLGAAWDSKILLYKTDDANGVGLVSASVSAIHAATAAGAKVLNLSWGIDSPSTILQAAIEDAEAHEVVVVTSAGNRGGFMGSPTQWPAAYDTVLSVTGSMPDGTAMQSATHNSTVDLAAPGDYLVTSLKPPSQYTLMLPGTSFASPLVAAAAGLMLRWRSGLRPSLVKAVLRASAHDVAPAGWDIYTGAGVLDAAAAVDLAKRVPSVNTAVTAVSAVAGSRVDVPLNVSGEGSISLAVSGGGLAGWQVSKTGTVWHLTGTPTLAGDTTVTVTASNATGVPDRLVLPVTVSPAAVASLDLSVAKAVMWADDQVSPVVAGFDRFGNRASTDGVSLVYPPGMSGCGFPAGQAPARRVCEVRAKLGSVTSPSVSVEVFDRSMLGLSVSGQLWAGGVLRVGWVDWWPGVVGEFSWRVDGQLVGTGLVETLDRLGEVTVAGKASYKGLVADLVAGVSVVAWPTATTCSVSPPVIRVGETATVKVVTGLADTAGGVPGVDVPVVVGDVWIEQAGNSRLMMPLTNGEQMFSLVGSQDYDSGPDVTVGTHELVCRFTGGVNTTSSQTTTTLTVLPAQTNPSREPSSEPSLEPSSEPSVQLPATPSVGVSPSQPPNSGSPSAVVSPSVSPTVSPGGEPAMCRLNGVLVDCELMWAGKLCRTMNGGYVPCEPQTTQPSSASASPQASSSTGSRLTKAKVKVTVKPAGKGRVRLVVKAAGLSKTALTGRVRVKFGSTSKTVKVKGSRTGVGSRLVKVPAKYGKAHAGRKVRLPVRWLGTKQTVAGLYKPWVRLR
jgi:hypothetical protein